MVIIPPYWTAVVLELLVTTSIFDKHLDWSGKYKQKSLVVWLMKRGLTVALVQNKCTYTNDLPKLSSSTEILSFPYTFQKFWSNKDDIKEANIMGSSKFEVQSELRILHTRLCPKGYPDNEEKLSGGQLLGGSCPRSVRM